MDIHFVANAKSAFAKRKPFYKIYCRQPFTLTERGMGYRKFFRTEIAKKSIDFTPVFEFGRAGIIKKIIEESEDCIPHLLSFTVQEKIKEGKLVYLDVCDMKTYICKQLSYHKCDWLSNSMKALLEYGKNLNFKKSVDIPVLWCYSTKK